MTLKGQRQNMITYLSIKVQLLNRVENIVARGGKAQYDKFFHNVIKSRLWQKVSVCEKGFVNLVEMFLE